MAADVPDESCIVCMRPYSRNRCRIVPSQDDIVAVSNSIINAHDDSADVNEHTQVSSSEPDRYAREHKLNQ